MDVELQQRAVEYMSLERKPDLARSNVVAMPPWEKRKSLLLRRMAAREVRGAFPLIGPHSRRLRPPNWRLLGSEGFPGCGCSL